MRTISALLALAKTSGLAPSHAQADHPAKLDELQAGLDEARLRVAALARFKHNKSAPPNASLGAPTLPTDEPWVTAIPAFIRAGETSVFASR